MNAFEPVALDDFLLKLFPRDYVSASSLKMFYRCPEQFRRRYVLGHKAPPSGNLIWGGADHRAVGANYEQKIQSQTDMPVGEVQELFVFEVEKGLDEFGGATEVLWDGRDYEGKTPEQSQAMVKDRGVKLVGAYQEQIAPAIVPATVEEEFLLPLEGMPPVKGFIDLTANRAAELFTPESRLFVVERKTKNQNRAPAQDDRFQARLYELATGLPVEFQVSVKAAAPKVVVHEPQPLSNTRVTVEALRRVVLGIAHCYAVYGEEQPWPDTGRLHTFACDFCGFRESCPWWEDAYWPGRNGKP